MIVCFYSEIKLTWCKFWELNNWNYVCMFAFCQHLYPVVWNFVIMQLFNKNSSVWCLMVGVLSCYWFDRRGISKFYDGKSKSFMSLADAASFPSVKDIAKPENAYARRRRNLMAFNHVWDKNRNFLLRSNGGGVSKRTISLNRSAVALAFATNYDSSSSCTSEESTSSLSSWSPPPRPRNQV
jgi:hypothetical protein